MFFVHSSKTKVPENLLKIRLKWFISEKLWKPCLNYRRLLFHSVLALICFHQETSQNDSCQCNCSSFHDTSKMSSWHQSHSTCHHEAYFSTGKGCVSVQIFMQHRRTCNLPRKSKHGEIFYRGTKKVKSVRWRPTILRVSECHQQKNGNHISWVKKKVWNWVNVYSVNKCNSAKYVNLLVSCRVCNEENWSSSTPCQTISNSTQTVHYSPAKSLKSEIWGVG